MKMPSSAPTCQKCLLDKTICVCKLRSKNSSTTPKLSLPIKSKLVSTHKSAHTMTSHTSTPKSPSSHSFTFSHGVNSYLSYSHTSSKNNTSGVIIKTNFKQSSSGTNRQAIGKSAVANIKYISREKANEQKQERDNLSENLSNLHDKDARKLSVDEEKELINSLETKGTTSFRRIMISPEKDTTAQEMAQITKRTLAEFEEKTGKKYDAVFAIHTNTEHTHAHILITSNKYNSLRLSKQELKLFRQTAIQKSNELYKQRQSERIFIKAIEEQLGKDSSKATNREVEHARV
jgi:Relaxase/Mobilisation nuclease domain